MFECVIKMKNNLNISCFCGVGFDIEQKYRKIFCYYLIFYNSCEIHDLGDDAPFCKVMFLEGFKHM